MAVRIDAAVIAIAGPVEGGAGRVVNSGWQVSGSLLKRRFDWPTLYLVNDFAAAAYGVLEADTRLRRLGGPAQYVSDYPRVVVGAGTGFGVAQIVKCADTWQVVASEGGHARFAPDTDEEVELLLLLRRRLGRSVQREDILSGRGLCDLYAVMAQWRGENLTDETDPAVVVSAAVAQKSVFCSLVLNAFCGILGAVAADIALDLGSTGGVCIAGGMAPRFGDFLDQSPFRSRFESHPVYRDYLEKIPTFLVTSQDPGLAGAAYLLRRHLAGEQKIRL